VILDSSAIIAILLRQPGHERLVELIAEESAPGVGAPTLVESGIVLTARAGQAGRTLLSRFIEESATIIIPFDHHHWATAVDAFSRYGKGRHPARLNFGDCLTYAVAKLASEPLLALGDDFAQTDLDLVS